MNLRTVESHVWIDPRSFELMFHFVLRKNNTIVFDKELAWPVYVDDKIEHIKDQPLNILNYLLIEHNHQPLTKEEIFLYKLTKDYQ